MKKNRALYTYRINTWKRAHTNYSWRVEEKRELTATQFKIYLKNVQNKHSYKLNLEKVTERSPQTTFWPDESNSSHSQKRISSF